MIVEPVFADRSGRRRRLTTAVGIATAAALLTAAGALMAGFSDAGAEGAPGWPASVPGHSPDRSRAVTTAPTSTQPPRGAVTATAVAPVTYAPTSPLPRASATASPSASASAGRTAGAPGRGLGRGHSPSARPSKKN